MNPAFDIYCRVVDNFGDAGVCWRLARQLAGEHGLDVRLHIDRPATLRSIEPRAVAGAHVAGVAIREWAGVDDAVAAPPPGDERTMVGERQPDVIVSAFGCELPATVRGRLAAGSPAPKPLWVNLEYLSAEEWVAGCHGLASVKPGDGAIEHFYYPGFAPATGGLLRERGLVEAREAFVAGGEPLRWLSARGLAPAAGERLFSLFCYPDAPLAEWFGLLSGDARPVRVLAPVGIADAAIVSMAGRLPAVGEALRLGGLTLQRFELLSQDEYDRLLWSCDLNFVRGEDSWVRAHWAARPFVWQTYRQAEDAHRAKLDAFLARFADATGPIGPAAAMMRAWCGAQALEPAWSAFTAALAAPGDAGNPALTERYRRWSAELARQSDLCSALLEFCRNRLYFSV